MGAVERRRRYRMGGAPIGGGWLAPPADWRLPATVAVSAGLAGSQAALAAASASASAKSRPSITVIAAGTEYVEWTVQEAGNAILSWAWSAAAGTAGVSKNGVDQGYTVQSPGNADYRRQAMLLTLQVGDVIRLTIAAGASTRTLYPLLHGKPASGPWDAHLIFGASREEQGIQCLAMEDSILAVFPTRDPIVFNYGVSGQTIGGLATASADPVSEFGGIVRYVACGSLVGNNITASRPYDASETAGLNGHLTTIFNNFNGAGWTVCLGATSFRAYPADTPAGAPAITPGSQTSGSLEYNDGVIFPFIAANMPYAYDSALLRSRADEYLETLHDRSNLNTDGIHGNATHYGNIRAGWVDSWFRYLYSGSWGSSQVEKRVADAEAKALDGISNGATAQAACNEASYALLALAASSAKTALQARLDAIHDNMLYKLADDAVTLAETTRTEADKNAAQLRIDAAASAGANVVALQARLDAVVVNPVIQTVFIRHGNASALAGWNALAEGTAAGVKIASLLNDAGGATGWGYEVITAWGGVATNSAQTSAIDWVPSAVLGSALYYNTTSATRSWRFTGLDDAKRYDIAITGSRTGGTGRNVMFAVNGGAYAAQFDAGNNVSQQTQFLNVAPVAGAITITEAPGTPNNTFIYLSATRIQEKNP